MLIAMSYNTRRILAACTSITDYLLFGSSLCPFGYANAGRVACRRQSVQVAAGVPSCFLLYFDAFTSEVTGRVVLS